MQLMDYPMLFWYYKEMEIMKVLMPFSMKWELLVRSYRTI